MRQRLLYIFTFLLLPVMLNAAPEKKTTQTQQALVKETADYRIRLRPRSPEQIAAFYTGRGFPQHAIDYLLQQCFITVGFKNKSKQVIWVDLSNWAFRSGNTAIARIHKDQWKTIWSEKKLEKRFQSTFRWTLMPESLDFRPFEGEGGNIILPHVQRPFDIELVIYYGENRNRSETIYFHGVQCADD